MRARLEPFRRDEGGAILVLSLFILVAMLLVTGVAIDVVRNEYDRVRIQGTLDRALLAATDTNNKLAPKSVVLDYFAKAELADFIDSDNIFVKEELKGDGSGDYAYREVEAYAFARTPTMFLNRIGIEELPVATGGRANEGASAVEIVLVLDSSGSMDFNDMTGPDGRSERRITALKREAKAFVDTIYSKPENLNRAAISIVTYSWNVNMSPAAAEYGIPNKYLNLPDGSTRKYDAADTPCFAFVKDSDFTSVAIPHTGAYSRVPYSYISGTGSPPDTNHLDCQQASLKQVFTPYTNVTSTLKNAIDAITPVGSTSIELGMKWGAAVIDPSFRPVNQKMNTKGYTPLAFKNLPTEYGGGSEKYIVLMTDGENMPNYTLKPEYRGGPSPIWTGTAKVDGYNRTYFSYYDASRSSNRYYVPSLDKWQSAPFGHTSPSNSGYPKQLNWEDLWKDYSVAYVAYYIIAPWLSEKSNGSISRNTYYDQLYTGPKGSYPSSSTGVGTDTRRNYDVSMLEETWYTEKDTRLRSICNLMQGKDGTTVFGISFNPGARNIKSDAELAASTRRGDKAIAGCASDYSFYFAAAKSSDLKAAFNKIAAQIIELRLTQ